MSYNRGLREQLSVVSCIDPDAYTAATYNGDVIDMQDFRRVIFILQAGDVVGGFLQIGSGLGFFSRQLVVHFDQRENPLSHLAQL